MDNKNNDKELSFTFVGKPIIEELGHTELKSIDYEKEYKKMQSRYNKLIDENKKLNKALVNLALKVK